MNNCPVFYKSLFSSTASKINVEMWDKALDTFDEKKYLESFHLLLDYVNAELRPKYGNTDGTVFKIPHGSIVVNIEIKDGMVNISAPFLEVQQNSIVPLLRQVCSLNFNNMDLAQIYLRENKLNFEYSCKIHELNPYKIYYILREICMTGDKYDDEYVTKFGTKRLYEPIVTPFPAEKAEETYKTIQEFIKNAIEYINYFESKRWFGFGWDMAALTLRQIEFYAQPQGQLKNDLEKAINDMYIKNMSIPERVTEAKKFLQELQSSDKAKFIEDLYFVQIFIPEKRRSSLQNIQENLEEEHKRTKEGMASGNYMAVVLGILFSFYNVYHHNNVQEDINITMVEAMEKSSGKSWEEAAVILSKALDKIMNGELSSGSKKSFLSRLFGK